MFNEWTTNINAVVNEKMIPNEGQRELETILEVNTRKFDEKIGTMIKRVSQENERLREELEELKKKREEIEKELKDPNENVNERNEEDD